MRSDRRAASQSDGGGAQGEEDMATPPDGSANTLCDDALAEIIGRLPAVSVLRCRAVCKRWRRITTDRSFLAAHAARRPLEMIVYDEFLPWAVETKLLSPGNGKSPRCGRRRFLCDARQLAGDGTWTGRRGHVVSSLDGLLLLWQPDALYTVCNPATRQWTNLPELTPDLCCSAVHCGFYFHSSSGEYRLLCEGTPREELEAGTSFSDTNRYYYVLSAGGTQPRRLGRTPWGSDSISLYEHPVAHRGSLHWLSWHPEGTRTGKMLAFHTVSETLRLMSRPPERPDDTTRTLFELDRELAVAALHGSTTLDIWVLQDYEMESWTLRHRFEAGSYPQYHGRVMSPRSGTILFGSPCCDVGSLYDFKQKKALRKDVDFGMAAPSFLTFRESLVSHAFFDSPRRSERVYISFSK
ncbi:hypothetical protein ACP70R_040660 [Stipagrostis hirtigluma subsp. patula]